MVTLETAYPVYRFMISRQLYGLHIVNKIQLRSGNKSERK